MTMSTDTVPEPPGHIPLPKGWVAEVTTYLEMTSPPAPRPVPAPEGMSLVPIKPDCAAYRQRFRAVGEPWLWGSRLLLDDSALAAIISDAAVEIFDLRIGADNVGLLELDFRQEGACELAFFGVVPEAIGMGAGRFLMNQAIERAWGHAPAIGRFWVHTCNNDHPDALAFYIRSGFVPYARSVECYPDPRVGGVLPLTSAPQIPVL
jgi:GNAT superfamily N-acetyltransferase